MTKDQFADAWLTVGPVIHLIGSKYLRASDVEDLVQDIALVAFLRREEFEDARHLGLWASRGARWLAIDRIRSLQRRHKLLQQAPRKRGSSGHVILQIEELISRLPDRQRQVIEKSLAGFTDREIAKSLAVAPSTVRSLRRHARYQLATEFGEDER